MFYEGLGDYSVNSDLLFNCSKHPEFNNVIEDVLQKKFDENIMNKAKNSKLVTNESQAEALYVILKLKKSSSTLNTKGMKND